MSNALTSGPSSRPLPSIESKSRVTIKPPRLPSLSTTGSVDCAVSPAARNTSDKLAFSPTIVTFLVSTELTGTSVRANRSRPIWSVLPSRTSRYSSIDSVSIARATTSAVIVAIIAGSAIVSFCVISQSRNNAVSGACVVPARNALSPTSAYEPRGPVSSGINIADAR